MEFIQLKIYELGEFANYLTTKELNHFNLISIGVVFLAGLMTSLSPCMISMLPLTIGYIGGSQTDNRLTTIFQSIWFALGLATTLAGLGILASSLGLVYGQIGIGLPLLVSAIAILMGLNLLEALPIQFPSLGGSMDWISQDLPHSTRSYLIGLTFGLIASPCSTPVLATLLAYVANGQNIWSGSLLLLSYSAGYVVPIILAGSFTGAIKKLLEIRRWSSWINPISGIILVGFGVVSIASRLF